MFCLVANRHGFLILLFSLLLCPSGNCGKIKEADISNDASQAPTFFTRRPIPWSKITVPNFLLPEVESDNSDFETFKTFVYILFAVTMVIVLYYCLQCCKCTKACSRVICGSTDFPRRTRNNCTRSSRLINRASRSRIARRIRSDRQYERILPELHNSRRNRTPRSHPVDIETSLAKSSSSDKPPDYSTVVLYDLEGKQGEFPEVLTRAETPPPSYDENIFK